MQFQYRFNEISGYGNYTVPAVGPIILQAVMLMGIGMSLGGWLWRHPRRKLCAMPSTAPGTKASA